MFGTENNVSTVAGHFPPVVQLFASDPSELLAPPKWLLGGGTANILI